LFQEGRDWETKVGTKTPSNALTMNKKPVGKPNRKWKVRLRTEEVIYEYMANAPRWAFYGHDAAKVLSV
jgi:hypothetical protein